MRVEPHANATTTPRTRAYIRESRASVAELTDRFAAGVDRRPSGRHPVDRVCAGRGIEHKLTRPFRPQTNGMVERFNRRIADAIRQRDAALRNGGKNKFNTHAERDAFIGKFVYSYNRTRLRCLDYKAPIEALDNLTEHYTKAGVRAFSLTSSY